MQAVTCRWLLSLLLAASALGAEHRVSSSVEFSSALALVKPGDAVIFKSGTWRDVKLNFRAKGEAGKPITLRAETPGHTIFQGSSDLVIDGPHLVVSGFKFDSISNLAETVTPDQVTVRRVVVFTTNANASRLTDTAIVNSGAGVTTYVHMRPGSQSNRVDHCWFSGQRGIGVTFYVEAHRAIPGYHRVEHNYFGDRAPGTGNGWETMRIGHSAQQEFFCVTTVASNYFYRCNGELECISNKSTGNNYLCNTFVENRGQLSLRHGNRAVIAGNFFDGRNEPEAQGVRMSGSDHVIVGNYFKELRDALIVYNGQVDPEPKGYAPVNNTLIASNAFENCENSLTLGVGQRGRTLTPRRLRIEHNLIQAKGPKIIHQVSPDIDVKYKANVVFGAELGVPVQDGIETRKPVLPEVVAVGRSDVGPAWMK